MSEPSTDDGRPPIWLVWQVKRNKRACCAAIPLRESGETQTMLKIVRVTHEAILTMVHLEAGIKPHSVDSECSVNSKA